MYSAFILNSKHFKVAIDTLLDFKSNVNVQLSATGLAIEALGPENVTFMKLHYPLKVEHADQECTIGIELAPFNKIIKHCKDEWCIHLKYQVHHPYLQLIYTYENKIQRRYQIYTRDVQEEMMEIKTNEYENTVHIPAYDFRKMCDSYGAFAKDMTIRYGGQRISFMVCCGFGKGRTQFLRTTDEDVQFDNTYKIDRLRRVTKITQVAQTIAISWHNKKIMQIKYKFGTDGHLSHYIAPQVHI